VSLTNVWLQTSGDGLVRGDQVVGIDVHPTPELTGKRAHWLIDVLLPSSIGNGSRGEWDVTVLHRTLVQTSQQPGDAATTLARLLAQLDAVDAAGVVTATAPRPGGHTGDEAEGAGRAEETPVRFRFIPFPSPPPGHHTGAEYL
jgi:hypothetical protein